MKQLILTLSVTNNPMRERERERERGRETQAVENRIGRRETRRNEEREDDRMAGIVQCASKRCGGNFVRQ